MSSSLQRELTESYGLNILQYSGDLSSVENINIVIDWLSENEPASIFLEKCFINDDGCIQLAAHFASTNYCKYLSLSNNPLTSL